MKNINLHFTVMLYDLEPENKLKLLEYFNNKDSFKVYDFVLDIYFRFEITEEGLRVFSEMNLMSVDAFGCIHGFFNRKVNYFETLKLLKISKNLISNIYLSSGHPIKEVFKFVMNEKGVSDFVRGSDYIALEYNTIRRQITVHNGKISHINSLNGLIVQLESIREHMLYLETLNCFLKLTLREAS